MRYLLVLALLVSSRAPAISQEYIEESIDKAANKVGVPAELLRAICSAESNLDPDSYNFADGGSNNHAFGMCQILHNTAKDYGFNDDRCNGDFRYRKEHRNYQHCKLFGPYTNAYYAARYLKSRLHEYNGSWINAIAAYNSGTVQICKTGWVYAYHDGEKTKLYRCEKGGLLNQRYVDRVLEALRSRECVNDSTGLPEEEKRKRRAPTCGKKANILEQPEK